VRLEIVHPEVAHRDCGHCQKWLYDEKTGKVIERGGIPVERPPGTHPPCRLHIKCPKGTPEQSKALNTRNRKAWWHYLECRAVGRFPDDPIVRQNAAIIRAVEDDIREGKLDLLMAKVGALGPFLEAMKSGG
jgi:hypothetical protein